MSEQKPHTPTPEQAQDLAMAAIEFGAATDTVAHDYVQKNGEGVLWTGKANAGTGVLDADIKIDYADKDLHPSADKPSSKRETTASVRDGDSTYTGELRIDPDSALNRLFPGEDSDASVERHDYGTHHFTEQNKKRAAALITSLAAKRMTKEAMGIADYRVEKINAAKETLAKRLAVKDESQGAEQIEVHTDK
jgi:hypothetical protein